MPRSSVKQRVMSAVREKPGLSDFEVALIARSGHGLVVKILEELVVSGHVEKRRSEDRWSWEYRPVERESATKVGDVKSR